MMQYMNPFAGLGGALPQSQYGIYFGVGSFDVRIEKVLLKPSQKGKGLLFIVETVVMTSNNNIDQAGQKRTWLQKMSDPNLALPAVKDFYYGLFGVSFDKNAQQFIDHLLNGNAALFFVSDSNPLMNYYVHLETNQKPTQKGGVFTVHHFTPFNYYAVGLSPPSFDALFAQAQAWQPQQAQQQWQTPPSAPQPQWGGPPPQQQQPQFPPPGQPWGAQQAPQPQWGQQQPPAQQWGGPPQQQQTQFQPPPAQQQPQFPPPGQPWGGPQQPPAQQPQQHNQPPWGPTAPWQQR